MHAQRQFAQPRTLLFLHKQAWTCTHLPGLFGEMCQTQECWTYSFILFHSLFLNCLLKTKGNKQLQDHRVKNLYALQVNHRTSPKQGDTSRGTLGLAKEGTQKPMEMTCLWLIATLWQAARLQIHQSPPSWLKGISEVLVVKKELSNKQRTHRFYYPGCQSGLLYKRIIIKKTQYLWSECLAGISSGCLFSSSCTSIFFNTDN